ncbi:hypothetical protein OG562_22925 [Streptomyces sp. NBC_01275]|uniref:hypothetical protein n=1 Tax=Streptomyces sp. NBC_01275 TaxID=2903807 RepID=UPI002253394B|nr:hypothetical protein [Streptomyces sp. NBC_01275]MCX4763766.1 hypothetical protein [Streptomyces sp. NBC_01275]
MEPIAPALLMALAGGTLGAAGQQVWASLWSLVRRRSTEGLPDGESRGEDELTALDAARDDEARARELAEALALRARQDPAFARALDAWRREAEAVDATPTGSGDVRSEISGGVFHGTVVQARDINGSVHFGGRS